VKIKPRLLQSATMSLIDFAGIFKPLLIICQNILNLFYSFATYKSGSIAAAGQIDAHVPQPIHFVLSILHLPPSPSTIAIAGHTAIQL
jgi:hypothetical protein